MMNNDVNENGDFFETVPWNIAQMNEIPVETIIPTVIADNLQMETCSGNDYVQRIALTTFDHGGELSFLDAPFSITAAEAIAAENLLHLSEANRLPLSTASLPSLDVDVAAVVNEAAAAVIESGQQDFNADEEQRKLFNLLRLSNPNDPVEEVPPQIDFRIIKCSNCLNTFEHDKFKYHVCDHDENQQLIRLENYNLIEQKEFQIELVFPEEHAAVRLLRENQIRIRRFLKEELKYEVSVNPVKCTQNITITIDDNGKSFISSEVELNCPALNATKESMAMTSRVTNGNKKSENAHECTICDRRFVHASGLLRHMEKHALDLIPSSNGRQTAVTQRPHSLRVVVKCQLCGRVFFKTKDAFLHFLTHFPNSSSDDIEMDNFMDVPYEAFVDEAIEIICNEQVSSSNNLLEKNGQIKGSNYLKVIILGSVLQCEFCDFIFTDVSYLFLHSSVHPPERCFECLSCEIAVKTSKEIYSHFQAECVFMRESLKVFQANTLRYFVCNVCEKKFQTLEHLHEHRYTAFHFFPRFNAKEQKLQAPCEYCEAVFENIKDLVFHFQAQHFKKCRRDNTLGGGYGNNQISNKLRQYLCDVCGKSYTQSSHLWQHLRFHQGVKPFACQEPGCSRKFTIRPDLHDHIRKCHTGERPFHCHICGKRFLTGSVFYQHRLIHRGERRYECNYCSKRFYRADALKNHTRIHTGEKPYDCEYCTKSFRQRGDCDKHTRARHAHLDENTRNMLKLQKLNLKMAAAAKNNEEQQQQQFQSNLPMIQ